MHRNDLASGSSSFSMCSVRVWHLPHNLDLGHRMNKTAELAYWINEREHMRIKKEETDLSPPWSVDPAMASVRYCNIRREEDRVTRWIAKHWRTPLAGSPHLTLAMVAARMINWPETLALIPLENIGKPLWFDTIKWIIKKGQQDHRKMWTSAYTISTCGRSMPKEDYVVDHVLREVATRDWSYRSGTKLAYEHEKLMKVDGLGSFLAAQVVADLKNTPGHPLSKTPDYWSWSAPGPGSLRGLSDYWGLKVTPGTYQPKIEAAYNEVKPHLYPYVGALHMQDFQNTLCEFSKFMRVKEGDGRVRNKYHPG